jgi:hypothetical protein
MTEDFYLSLNSRERLELLVAAARERGLAQAILEKDYWVCKTLEILFALPDLGRHLVFKGGTSLSKGYRLIERFSEDVDLSFHREFLGFGAEKDPEAATGKEQVRRVEALQVACQNCIREVLLPRLRDAMAGLLGHEVGWSLEIDRQDAQTLLFHFPQAGGPGLAYVAPAVRIELGARSDHWPAKEQEVRSYLSEIFDRPAECAAVSTLSAERTFWEKATILHAEAHRPAEKPMPARYARHYHDLARLAASPVAERALADATLRERVVAHKAVYFRSKWAGYDFAQPSTFRLIPPAFRLAALEVDHRSMLPMFFAPPPPLGEVLEKLAALEARIHALPPYPP